MHMNHARLALFTLGLSLAQACGDPPCPPPEPLCNDDGKCDPEEEFCLDCAMCGDGVLDPSETCDDGNKDDEDACVDNCQLASCNDGHILKGVETCDDGDQNSDDYSLDEHCNARCTALVSSFCGDVLCDPQNESNATCATDCPPDCGNGIVEVGESCDDMGNSEKCDDDCTERVCGDKFVNDYSDVNIAKEFCDDGNHDNTDECVNECVLWSCGDGHVKVGIEEQCEDQNQDETDSCDNQCHFIEHRKVFVTSMAYLGDLGGLDGADAKCNALATAAGLDEVYQAWLSDSVEGPATRFDTDFNGVYELNDKDRTLVVAGGWKNLVKLSLMHAIDVDESGNENVTGVWTNTTATGMPQDAQLSCSNWSGTGSSASVGNSGELDIRWTLEFEDQSCASGFSLYCFQGKP